MLESTSTFSPSRPARSHRQGPVSVVVVGITDIRTPSLLIRFPSHPHTDGPQSRDHIQEGFAIQTDNSIPRCGRIQIAGPELCSLHFFPSVTSDS